MGDTLQDKLQELIFRLERMSADEIPKEWVLIKLKEMIENPIPKKLIQSGPTTFAVDEDEDDSPKERMVDVHTQSPEIPFCLMIPSSLGVGETFLWQGRTYRLFLDGLYPIDTN